MSYQRTLDEARRLAEQLPSPSNPERIRDLSWKGRSANFCQHHLRLLLDLVNSQERSFHDLSEKTIQKDVEISRLKTLLHVTEMDLRLTRNELKSRESELALVTTSHRGQDATRNHRSARI